MKWLLLGLCLVPVFFPRAAVLAFMLLLFLAGMVFYLFHRGIADFQDYE